MNASIPEAGSDVEVTAQLADAIGDLPELESGEEDAGDRLHSAPCLSDTNLKRIRATPHYGGSSQSMRRVTNKDSAAEIALRTRRFEEGVRFRWQSHLRRRRR